MTTYFYRIINLIRIIIKQISLTPHPTSHPFPPPPHLTPLIQNTNFDHKIQNMLFSIAANIIKQYLQCKTKLPRHIIPKHVSVLLQS